MVTMNSDKSTGRRRMEESQSGGQAASQGSQPGQGGQGCQGKQPPKPSSQPQSALRPPTGRPGGAGDGEPGEAGGAGHRPNLLQAKEESPNAAVYKKVGGAQKNQKPRIGGNPAQKTKGKTCIYIS